MELVDSYLNEVRQFLPAAQRDDIVTELRDAIEERLVDVAQGREPTSADESLVLQRMGHPLKVASSYREQRYLIGPDLYPGYLHTLKYALIFVAFVNVAVALIAAASIGDWTLSFSAIFDHALSTGFWVAAIVTGVFVSLEYSGERLKWYEDWRPSTRSGASTAVIDRGDMVINLISEGLFLFWWNDLLVLQNWLPFLDGEVVVTLSAVWAPLYWPLNLLFGTWFLLHAYVLARGVWQRSTLVAEIALSISVVAAGMVLWLEENLVNLAGKLNPDLTQSLQQAVHWSLVVIAGFVVWDLVRAFRLLHR